MKCIVDGLAIEYEDKGSGSTILMLHGWGDTMHTFDGLAATLPGRVVRPDLPGFGESDMPKKDWALDDYVQFVRSFIHKLGIRPDVLIGHSMGGRIILKGVAEGIFNPKRIVLIASAGVAERKTLRNFFLGLIAKIGRAVTSIPPLNSLRETLRSRLYATIGSDYRRAGALRGTLLNIIREDLRHAASDVKVPALLVWGAHDQTTPLSEGKLLAGLISGSHLRIVPAAGHFVHHDKLPEVSAIMRQFLT